MIEKTLMAQNSCKQRRKAPAGSRKQSGADECSESAAAGKGGRA